MISKRQERNQIFNQFLETAEAKFKLYKAENERALYFEKIYSFYAVAGGRIGGLDKRVFEVFFGSRPFDTIHRNLEKRNLIEEGSTLMIQINDIGLVYISIFPAKTEIRSLVEDSISIYNSIEPKRLLSDSFLKRIWMEFIAYTEYSSLDGHPSYFQKIRIQYLRYSNNLVINGKEQDRRLTKLAIRLIENILSIGLSGFLIFIFSVYLQKQNESHTIQQLKELNNNILEIEQMIRIQDSTRLNKEDLGNIIFALDSLDRSSIDTVIIKLK